VLKKFGSLQTSAFHPRAGRDGPRFEHNARSCLDGQAVVGQLGHLSPSHVEKAATLLRNVCRVNGVDTEIDGITPWSSRMIGVDHAQTVVGGE